MFEILGVCEGHLVPAEAFDAFFFGTAAFALGFAAGFFATAFFAEAFAFVFFVTVFLCS
jgi:hypothetical protein